MFHLQQNAIKAELQFCLNQNRFKLEQIPSIIANQKAKSNGENESDSEYVTVYKLGDFVDISKGPMINSTSQIGRFEVTGIFDMDTENYGRIHRIQGVAIPKQLNVREINDLNGK